MATLLLATLVLPLAGLLMVGGDRTRARQSALVTTLFVMVVALYVAGHYRPNDSKTAAITTWSWVAPETAPVDIRFSVGLDGLSVWLYALTSVLMVVAVLVSWEAIVENASRFYRLLLLLEMGMLGVFVARDIILFYIFFEFTLIPLFFLIGLWGSEQRQYAAVKFFLYTLAGSLLTFLGLLAIVLWDGYNRAPGSITFSIVRLTQDLTHQPLPPTAQLWIFLALFVGFAIKVPLFPLHTWLPLAHVQAPTAGSVLLAGVLLKIGTYGFLRFSLPMLPDATAMCMPWILGLSVAGILYGALVALAQSDLKRLIAYSSVSHLGFCMLGLFAVNPLGVQGSALQMINHGLSTGALFALVGMLYERYHTRQIAELGGLAREVPLLAFFFVFFTLSSIGLPGLNGFAGEILILLGMFQRAWAEAPLASALWLKTCSVLAVLGVVIGAWYMLQLVERIFFGAVRVPRHGAGEPEVRDLRPRETAALALLGVFVVWIGVWPNYFLSRMSPTLGALTERARARVDALATAPGDERGPSPLSAATAIDRNHAPQ